jgi:Family of unknown function (DUF5330)
VWRLIRIAFWMSMVIVLLPIAPSPQTATAPHVGAAEALSAAVAAVSDMRQFCARQPETCAVGSQVMVQFGHTTEANVKRLYEFFNERKGANNHGAVDATNSAESRQKVSRDTLTLADLAAPWHGPQKSDRIR